MITIFTPTYNRKTLLKNLYNSLLQQNYKNFEWLIVDDGSTDKTNLYVEHIRKENKIRINYIYKENGGKPSAYNVGLENAKGDIFLCIDSDDILSNDSLEIISEDFNKKYNNSIIGFAYNRAYTNKKDEIIGTKFPEEIKEAYYYDIYGKYKVKGDKFMTFKTDIAKNYMFPIIGKEKFVPEALLFNRISKKYKFGLSNKIVAFSEYLSDGYSSNYYNLVKQNPKSNALYFKEAYDIKSSFYNVYGYILFCLYSKLKFKEIYKGHKAKLKVLILYLPVLILSKIK